MNATQVNQIKSELASGTYDYSGAKEDVAIDRLVDELLDAGKPEAPALPEGFVCADWDGLN
jgi:hypothetical protein